MEEEVNHPQPLEYATPQPRPKSRAWELISDYFAFFCLGLLALFCLGLGLLAWYYHRVAYR